jgi:hypothetical protein
MARSLLPPAVGVLVGLALTLPAAGRLAMAVALGLTAFALGLRKPQTLVLAVIIWLPCLGVIRRLVSQTLGPSSNDLLLLVLPAATVILVMAAAGQTPMSGTRLARAVLILNALTVLSAFNPLQGGLAVGFSGLLFLLVPTLWFWIGNSLIDAPLLMKILTLVAGASVMAAAYGLVQTFAGFPQLDRNWIELSGYAALNVGGTIRAFGSFSSSAEYAMYLAIGLIVLWTIIRVRVPAFVLIPLVFLEGAAIFLDSSRGVVVLTVIGVAAVTSAQWGVGLSKASLLVAASLVALSFGLQRVYTGGPGASRVAALVQHQVAGLAKPTDSKESTLLFHARLVLNGLADGVRNPVGRGAGAVSIASSRFGGNAGRTEVDFSNVAVALGLPGLALFIYIAFSGWLLSYRHASRDRDPLVLAALGVLLVTSFQWLNGGQYAVAPLPWLVLGWLDRRSAETTADPSSSAPLVHMGSDPGPL